MSKLIALEEEVVQFLGRECAIAFGNQVCDKRVFFVDQPLPTVTDGLCERLTKSVLSLVCFQILILVSVDAVVEYDFVCAIERQICQGKKDFAICTLCSSVPLKYTEERLERDQYGSVIPAAMVKIPETSGVGFTGLSFIPFVTCSFRADLHGTELGPCAFYNLTNWYS